MHVLAVPRRSGRTLFLMYLCGVYVAVMSALPFAHALMQVRSLLPLHASYPTFEQMDRNRDGFIDRAEATALPGLAATFEGRIDKVRFARAHALLNP
jgi:hypothetical protein